MDALAVSEVAISQTLLSEKSSSRIILPMPGLISGVPV
jgi:hypothetical protein